MGAPDDISRSLWLTALYRLFVAAFLLGLGTLAQGDPGFVPASPRVYFFGASSYLAVALVLVLLARDSRAMEIKLQDRQVIGGTLVDVAAIGLILVATGGVQTGLGLLLIPAVAAAATMTRGRISLLLAAVATLTVLTTELAIGPAMPWPFEPAPTQAGLLGATLFAAVLLTWRMAQRAGHSEAKVERQEADLANLAELNAQIIARMGAGVIAVDPDGYIRSINEAARRLLPPRAGLTLRDLSPQLNALLENWRLERGQSASRQLRGDAEQTELEVRLTRLGVYGEQGTLLILENAAEIKRRAHAAKLQSIGRLTASIAHEIRNPLGAISHSAQLLAESNLDPADQRLLAIIQKQSQRVDGVIRNVLGLSSGRTAQREWLPLRERLERFAEDFCGALQIPRKSLHISVHPRDSDVLFDPSHLSQVLWNLCMNARSHGGHDNPDSGPIVLRGGAGQIRKGVTLDVIDNGPGIPPEQQEDLFEPFASTAPGGTGLGLYVSRLICENNGAALEYVQQPHGGCFRILFALSDRAASDTMVKEPWEAADNPG